MKKTRVSNIIALIMITVSVLLGCKDSSEDKYINKDAVVSDCDVAMSSETEKEITESVEIEETDKESENEEEAIEEPEESKEEETAEDRKTDIRDEAMTVEDVVRDIAKKPIKGIVWLGDSLTQGSLGENNDNLENAPYVKLADYTDIPVEGYGFYGYNTHDIFWVYTDDSQYNQETDKDKFYILWVGSNDWVRHKEPVNTDIEPIVAEIEHFLSRGPVENYLILGTTKRKELREEIDGRPAYEIINEKLKAYYGNRYMDVNDVIDDENGYVEDSIHLTQESYDRVAEKIGKLLQ